MRHSLLRRWSWRRCALGCIEGGPTGDMGNKKWKEQHSAARRNPSPNRLEEEAIEQIIFAGLGEVLKRAGLRQRRQPCAGRTEPLRARLRRAAGRNWATATRSSFGAFRSTTVATGCSAHLHQRDRRCGIPQPSYRSWKSHSQFRHSHRLDDSAILPLEPLLLLRILLPISSDNSVTYVPGRTSV